MPAKYSWQRLLDAAGIELEAVYTEILQGLGRQGGTLGTSFRKAQNRIQDPAKLKRLVVDLIDKENCPARAPTSRVMRTRRCWPKARPTRAPAPGSTSPRAN